MTDFLNYDMKRLTDAIKTLRLHFDTVQIFCTRYNDTTGVTQTMSNGDGDWYGRYGFIKAFVNDTEKGYIVSGMQPSQEKTEF